MKNDAAGEAKPKRRSTVRRKGGKATECKKPRRPHNAHRVKIEVLEELVLKVGAEPRKVMKDGEVITMSRAECVMRAEVEAALGGQVRALAYLLKLIAKYPKLARSSREEIIIFINGDLAQV
ncbi:hypothetical protein G7A66_09360 [Altererythrobacter sp. SALINAS58]|uniref:DUF5681 domain-containing protein n=1 Tax=Alteripontixanthobacter muriae TaxID=2705546 RepID=UPI0015775467|nr:DUF5681 domain-containing protein [Alteripontixanthobacter muriae]NTZ43289.1 hypothetical protein [Alteripontixanthobacter muriae]